MIKKQIKAIIYIAIFTLFVTVIKIQAQSEVKAEYAPRRAGKTRMIALYNLAAGSEEDCPTPFEYKGSIVKTHYDDELGTKIIGFTIADRNNRRTYFNIDENLYDESKLPRVDIDWIDTLITEKRQVGVLAYGCGAAGRVLIANNIVDLAFIKSPTILKNISRQESNLPKLPQGQRTSNAKINHPTSENVVWLRNKDNPVKLYGQKWSEDYYYGIENYREQQIGIGGLPPKIYKYYDPDNLSYEWEPYYNKLSNCRTSDYNPEPTYKVKLSRPEDVYIDRQPRALYTKKAWQAKTEGSIRLKVVLLADGTVGQITPLNQLPNGLTDSAIRSACYITFRAATNADLQPINSTQILTYQFNLSQSYTPKEYSYPKQIQNAQENQPKTEEIVPLRILSKPRAPYTTEARENEITGVVALRITFLASGKIGSISVVRGLPNGLTQEAIKAAQNIKFEPQTKGGVPYTVVKQYEWSFSLY
jgi:TonB family protein